jgi:hypothetical protein
MLTNRKLAAANRRAALAIESYQTFAAAMDESGAWLEPGFSLFGVTQGQFSMIDVIRYFVDRLKPARVTVWTWAIASYEVEAFEYFYQCGDITAATLIIDRSAEDRNAVLIDRWREKFGIESVKVCKTHAKIATIEGDGLRVLCRGSMNLNHNPRFEQFDVSEGGPAFELVRQIESEIPVMQPRCSNHDADAASNLLSAWSEDDLKPFDGVKTWNK